MQNKLMQCVEEELTGPSVENEALWNNPKTRQEVNDLCLQRLHQLSDCFAKLNPKENWGHEFRRSLPEMNTVMQDDAFFEACHSYSEIIRKTRMIMENPVICFLLALPAEHKKHYKQLEGLAAWIAIIGDQHLQKLNKNERVWRAFRECRLLADTSLDDVHAEVLPCIPEMHTTLKLLCMAFRNITDAHEKSDMLLNRFRPLHRILDDVANNSLVYNRSRTQEDGDDLAINSLPEERLRPFVVERIADDPDTPVYMKLKAPAVRRERAEKGIEDEGEFQADNCVQRDTLLIELPEEPAIQGSLILVRPRSRAIAMQIARREKLLMTDMCHLTRHDVQIFIREALTEKGQLSDTIQAVRVWSLLAFLTGRSLGLLKSIYNHAEPTQELKLIGGIWNLIYAPDLPAHEKVVSPAIILINPSKEKVHLQLPLWFSELVGGARLPAITEDVMEKAAGWLSAINHQYKTRLTPARLTSNLRFQLKYQGVDTVHAGLICGDGGDVHAGMYYLQFEVGSLAAIYAKHIRTLKDFLPAEYKTISEKDFGKNGFGGSHLKVKDDKASSLLKHWHAYMQKTKRQYVQYHNYYTLYCLSVLFLSTGHRPVNDPFDDLNSFNLTDGKIFISDKESRSSPSARTVILPVLALDQLKYYLQHLQTLKSYCNWQSSLISEHISCVLKGNKPLFFWLDENTESVIRVTGKSLAARNKGVWDLPLNWHRHYLRSILTNANIASDIIDAWMGHAAPGCEGFSPYSSLSMQHMKQVADFLDHDFKLNGISPQKGWCQND